jgi:hypothetical protein
MRLADDICRCVNDECRFKKECARFMCIEIGQRTPVAKFPSINKMDWSCSSFIRYEPTPPKQEN